MLRKLGCAGVLLCLAVLLPALAQTPLPQGLLPRELPAAAGVIIHRDPPQFTFSVLPVTVINSYYDYMIGSYHSLPLRVVPTSAGGGYFMTYHGKRTATASRRVFYCYLTAQGVVLSNTEISTITNNEGFPTLAVDPLSGKPFYAWNANGDTDPQLEIQLVSDAFIAGISGLFNDIVNVIDNPISITAPNDITTTDNEFVWPTAVIGPSPLTGKRRIYVLGRNSVMHGGSLASNAYIARADFNAMDIENGNILAWSYLSIPELNNWNVDGSQYRVNYSLVADNSGNLYLAGYRQTAAAMPELDVYKCPNYGMGTWSRVSATSSLPSWNLPALPGGTAGYFEGPSGAPYADADLTWTIMNSGHLNATVDNLGRLHIPGIWGLTTPDWYYPNLQFVKEFVYDPAANTIEVVEIHPRCDPDNTFSPWYQPWDIEPPWGEVDYYIGGVTPNIVTDWPFPHWDASAHNDAMMFRYNNIKVTEANPQGMMAAVWQNSYRARRFNYYGVDPYSAYANTPEIFISVSPDNGDTWLEPISLNNVEIPQFAGLKPMWVYPADKVIYTGMQGDAPVGKLGLMFYNDTTWGANAISPPYHPANDGGQVMFTELQIVFAPNWVAAQPTFTPPQGLYTYEPDVMLNCSTAGASIRYTTDGSDPDQDSTLYTAPIHLTESTTIKARAYCDGYEPSPIATATYTLQVIQTTFSPGGGNYTAPISVTLACPTPNSYIHYTLDGSTPDPEGGSPLYTEPIQLPGQSQTTIRARAFRTGWQPSNITSAAYLITGTVEDPLIEPPAGTYEQAIQVEITCPTPGATIRYTLNGLDPTTSSPIYNGPFTLSQSALVKSFAHLAYWAPSQIVSAEYEIVVANPEETQAPVVTGIHKTWPNPFSSLLNLELGIRDGRQPYSLKIYNVRGACVYANQGVERAGSAIAGTEGTRAENSCPRGCICSCLKLAGTAAGGR